MDTTIDLAAVVRNVAGHTFCLSCLQMDYELFQLSDKFGYPNKYFDVFLETVLNISPSAQQNWCEECCYRIIYFYEFWSVMKRSRSIVEQKLPLIFRTPAPRTRRMSSIFKPKYTKLINELKNKTDADKEFFLRQLGENDLHLKLAMNQHESAQKDMQLHNNMINNNSSNGLISNGNDINIINSNGYRGIIDHTNKKVILLSNDNNNNMNNVNDQQRTIIGLSPNMGTSASQNVNVLHNQIQQQQHPQHQLHQQHQQHEQSQQHQLHQQHQQNQQHQQHQHPQQPLQQQQFSKHPSSEIIRLSTKPTIKNAVPYRPRPQTTEHLFNVPTVISQTVLKPGHMWFNNSRPGTHPFNMQQIPQSLETLENIQRNIPPNNIANNMNNQNGRVATTQQQYPSRFRSPQNIASTEHIQPGQSVIGKPTNYASRGVDPITLRNQTNVRFNEDSRGLNINSSLRNANSITRGVINQQPTVVLHNNVRPFANTANHRSQVIPIHIVEKPQLPVANGGSLRRRSSNSSNSSNGSSNISNNRVSPATSLSSVASSSGVESKQLSPAAKDIYSRIKKNIDANCKYCRTATTMDNRHTHSSHTNSSENQNTINNQLSNSEIITLTDLEDDIQEISPIPQSIQRLHRNEIHLNPSPVNFDESNVIRDKAVKSPTLSIIEKLLTEPKPIAATENSSDSRPLSRGNMTISFNSLCKRLIENQMSADDDEVSQSSMVTILNETTPEDNLRNMAEDDIDEQIDVVTLDEKEEEASPKENSPTETIVPNDEVLTVEMLEGGEDIINKPTSNEDIGAQISEMDECSNLKESDSMVIDGEISSSTSTSKPIGEDDVPSQSDNNESNPEGSSLLSDREQSPSNVETTDIVENENEELGIESMERIPLESEKIPSEINLDEIQDESVEEIVENTTVDNNTLPLNNRVWEENSETMFSRSPSPVVSPSIINNIINSDETEINGNFDEVHENTEIPTNPEDELIPDNENPQVPMVSIPQETVCSDVDPFSELNETESELILNEDNSEEETKPDIKPTVQVIVIDDLMDSIFEYQRKHLRKRKFGIDEEENDLSDYEYSSKYKIPNIEEKYTPRDSLNVPTTEPYASYVDLVNDEETPDSISHILTPPIEGSDVKLEKDSKRTDIAPFDVGEVIVIE